MLVPFVAYAERRRFIGYLDSGGGEQIGELLNRGESIVIREAFVEDFDEDTVVNLGDGEIDRSIVYAVETGAPRTDPSHRIRTVRHRLQVHLGPYNALGLLHSQPGQQPLPYLHASGPMIALSDATLAYQCRGHLTLRDVGTLIVNRDLIDWVRASDGDAVAFPGVRVLTEFS